MEVYDTFAEFHMLVVSWFHGERPMTFDALERLSTEVPAYVLFIDRSLAIRLAASGKCAEEHFGFVDLHFVTVQVGHIRKFLPTRSASRSGPCISRPVEQQAIVLKRQPSESVQVAISSLLLAVERDVLAERIS